MCFVYFNKVSFEKQPEITDLPADLVKLVVRCAGGEAVSPRCSVQRFDWDECTDSYSARNSYSLPITVKTGRTVSHTESHELDLSTSTEIKHFRWGNLCAHCRFKFK